VKDGVLEFSSVGWFPLPMRRTTDTHWAIGGGALPDGGEVAFSGGDRFTHDSSDNRQEYVRTAEATPTAAQLAEFAGAYASEETGATYRVAVEEGQLVVRIDRWPEKVLKLTPSYRDAFLSNFWLVRFYRDRAGRIAEMSLADNRMRDLRAPRLK
jgi:hypothetical protein